MLIHAAIVFVSETNMGHLASIYGKESNIYGFKKTVVRLRDYHLGIQRPELAYKLPEEQSALEIEREKYWGYVNLKCFPHIPRDLAPVNETIFCISPDWPRMSSSR